MPFGNLLAEVMAAYSCDRKAAVAIIEVARTKGVVVDTGCDTCKIVDDEAI